MSATGKNRRQGKASYQQGNQEPHDQRLTLALAAGRAGTFDWDIKNSTISWSDELLAIYGMTRDEFGGRYERWLECVVPDDRERTHTAASTALRTGVFEEYFRICRPDNGEIRWVHGRGTVSFDEANQPVAMVGISVDVTDLKAAQEKSAASELRFQSILETEAVGVLFLDRTGRIIGANPPFLRMTGYSYDEIHSGSLSWRDLTPPEWERVTEEQMNHMAASGRIGPYEKEFFLKDGSRRWMRFTGRDIGDGTIAEYCFDIQDQKQAETALRESEAKYRALFESMDEGYVLTEVIFNQQDKPVDMLYLEANDAAVKMTGMPLVGRRTTQISPNFEPHWFETFGRVARTGIGERHEFPVAPLNALYDIYIFRVGHPFSNRVAAVYRDITDRKRHEEALLRSEERFRFIGDRAQVGYWDWDIPSDSLEFSPQCNKLFGIPDGEPVSYARFLEALHPDDRDRTNQTVFACLRSDGAEQKEYDIEYRSLWPDRTVHWIRAKGAATFRDGAPQRMAGIAIDISESKHVEQALEQTMELIREAEAQFRTLAESVPQLVWTCKASGECDYLSSQWVDYTGVPSEQQLGDRWLDRLHPEDRENTTHRWQESLNTTTVFDVEFRLQNRYGRYRWFKTRAHAHRSPTGEVTKWFGTCTDIEDQKRTEDELRRANNDLQQFAYSASHDLKQPLRNMVIYGQLLQRKAAPLLDQQTGHLLDVIVKNGQRMNQLLSDLLDYASAASAPEPKVPAATDSQKVLDNVVSDLQLSIAENGARINADPLPVIGVSETHFQQLLQNLISNAIKYRKESEPPSIHLSAVPQPSHFWQFSLADNGIGIDPEHHTQIFGLFRRLHGNDGKYEGTGLGLAICQRIVERYGGRIWLESETGKGTTFYFTVPGA